MNYSVITDNKVIPVVVIKNIEDTIPTLNALREGGIMVAEITFRTACASDAIKLGRETFPDMIIGAGTVINSEQCKSAIESGAQFIVGPGLSESVRNVCFECDIPYLGKILRELYSNPCYRFAEFKGIFAKARRRSFIVRRRRHPDLARHSYLSRKQRKRYCNI